MFKPKFQPIVPGLILMLLSGSVILSACGATSIPTGTPVATITPEPVPGCTPDVVGADGCAPPAPTYNSELLKGEYVDVINATGSVIESAKKDSSEPGVTDAFLYRGLAELLQSRDTTDLRAAEADLLAAYKLKDSFLSIYSSQEKVLLYRGLMVVSAKLGRPKDVVQKYHDAAVALAPDQVGNIDKELNNRALILTPLTIPSIP